MYSFTPRGISLLSSMARTCFAKEGVYSKYGVRLRAAKRRNTMFGDFTCALSSLILFALSSAGRNSPWLPLVLSRACWQEVHFGVCCSYQLWVITRPGFVLRFMKGNAMTQESSTA